MAVATFPVEPYNRRLLQPVRFLTSFVRANPLGGVSIVVLAVILAIGFIGPSLTKDPLDFNLAHLREAPSGSAIFGTDDKGRDVFARTVSATEVSLTIGLLAAGLGVTFGLVFGLVTGYVGGVVDAVGQRIVETFLAFPTLILAMAFTVAFGRSVENLSIVLAVITWPSAARIIRSAVLSQSSAVYVQSARAVGSSPARVVVRHILPNLVSIYLVVLTVSVAHAILTEASLSFLGLGVPPPQPSLGAMVLDAQKYFEESPYLAIFPGVTIALAVLSFNSLGDALRDYLDPRLRRR